MSERGTPKKQTTLADVAARAGVSQMTVSKVMRSTGSISAETRERVKMAANDLGYVPNLLAGALSSRTSKIVAVVLPSINDAVFGDVVSGINEVLRPEGYMTFIGESHFEPETEEGIIQTVLSLQPAGVIVTGGINRTERASQLLRNWRCPIIQIWDEEEDHFDGAIAPSHNEAGRVVAQHFLDQGFKRPAYIGAELGKDVCAARRFDAFKATILEAGLELVEVASEDLPRQAEAGRVQVEGLMRQHPEVDSIYFLNDAMALGALSWLYEAGYSVPDQVAVAGFNGTSLAHSVRTRLTTVHIERLALGVDAARAVLASIAEKPVPKMTPLRVELSKGNTT